MEKKPKECGGCAYEELTLQSYYCRRCIRNPHVVDWFTQASEVEEKKKVELPAPSAVLLKFPDEIEAEIRKEGMDVAAKNRQSLREWGLTTGSPKRRRRKKK